MDESITIKLTVYVNVQEDLEGIANLTNYYLSDRIIETLKPLVGVQEISIYPDTGGWINSREAEDGGWNDRRS